MEKNLLPGDSLRGVSFAEK